MSQPRTKPHSFSTFSSQAATLLRSALIILAFLLTGKAVSQLFAAAIPGSVIGLMLLFFALSSRLVPLQWVQPVGGWLLQYMTLFFVPVGVALLNYTQLLQQYWLAIAVSSLVSTVLVFAIVGRAFQRLAK